MKKLILLTVFLLVSNLVSAQYVAFFRFKTTQPEMAVSTISDMIESDFGKSIPATVNLFALFFGGDDETTHMVTFDFMSEADLQSFMTSWGASKVAQLFGSKFDSFSTPISQYIATPMYFKGDWMPDQVFMIWNFDVKDPGTFVQEFAAFTDAYVKKQAPAGSYGIGMPIVGQTPDFSHFVWVGSPDIATALSFTKTMYADPSFSDYSKKMAKVRTLKSTYLMQRLMTFK